MPDLSTLGLGTPVRAIAGTPPAVVGQIARNFAMTRKEIA